MAYIVDDDTPRTRSGWSCPGCGRCYGPRVGECPYCPAVPTFPLNLPPVYPVPLDEPVTPAIFVPLRDFSLPIVPAPVRSVQDALNEAARATGNIVDGKFVVLPQGAKILPAHPGRGWMRLPDEMTSPHYNRIVQAGREWGQVWPGLECRLGSFGGVNDDAYATISLRLTPAEGQ